MIALVAALHCGTSAYADSLDPIPGPPLVSLVDDNYVDLISGDFQYTRLDVSIGDKETGLTRIEDNVGADNYTGAIYNLHASYGAVYPLSNGVRYFSVSLGRNSQKFDNKLNGPFMPLTDGGGQLSCGATECEYTLKDGTIARYSITYPANGDIIKAILASITKPDGEVISITYPATAQTNAQNEGKQRSVTSSLGWMIKYGPVSGGSEIYAVNLSSLYCAASAESCPGGSAPWPAVKLDTGGVKDKLGNYWRIAYLESYSPCNSGNYPCLMPEGCYPGENSPCPYIGPPLSPFYPARKITSIKSPLGVETVIGYASDPYIVQTGDIGTSPEGGDLHWVSYVWKGASRWTYSFETRENDPSLPYSTQRTRVISPDGGTRTVFYKSGFNVIPGVSSDADQTGNVEQYFYDATPVGYKIGKVARADATWSGATLTGGYTKYTYDARGNATEVRQIARAGTGLPDLVTTAGYDTTCSNTKTCNKPNWVKNANGGQTDFEYSSVHGMVLKETSPPDATGVRPQKRYSYALLYPKVRDASGNLINSTPVYRLTEVSSCQTATAANPAACIGTAEEVKTLYTYANNNLLKTSQTQVRGDGTQAATTSFTYDVIGNVTSIDGPRTDVDDKSFVTYDGLRRPVFEISPSPAANGVRLITKHSYDADGREYLTEVGTGTATDGSNFTVDRFTRRSFDSTTGLLVKTEVGKP